MPFIPVSSVVRVTNCLLCSVCWFSESIYWFHWWVCSVLDHCESPWPVRRILYQPFLKGVSCVTSRCQWGPAIMGILIHETWVVQFMSGKSENDIVTKLSLLLTWLASVLKAVAGLVLSMNVSQPVKYRKSLYVNIIISLSRIMITMLLFCVAYCFIAFVMKKSPKVHCHYHQSGMNVCWM